MSYADAATPQRHHRSQRYRATSSRLRCVAERHWSSRSDVLSRRRHQPQRRLSTDTDWRLAEEPWCRRHELRRSASHTSVSAASCLSQSIAFTGLVWFSLNQNALIVDWRYKAGISIPRVVRPLIMWINPLLTEIFAKNDFHIFVPIDLDLRPLDPCSPSYSCPALCQWVH